MDPLYGQRTTHTKTDKSSGKWVIIDAKDQVMGRLASRVASVLLGKTKPTYQPGALAGDRVIVINASQMKVSGDKVDQKLYHWHTGYFGGIKSRNMKKQLELVPEKVIFEAVKGMLPKNRYGKSLMTRLRVYQGGEHGMEAQKPEIAK